MALAAAAEPCCKSCELPKVKVFSTDAKHGFCGEGCMDPKSFGLFHKFESNLTIAEDEHPCPEQWTPLNDKQYTDYFSTVTHGLGPISMTLDLYAPTNMPKHECCSAPLIPKLGCPGILGKPTSLLIDGTGPFCCPEGATPEQPCGSEDPSMLSTEVGALMAPAAAVLAKETTEPCCKSCELPKVKVFSTDAKHGFCGEGCMDPKSFGLFHKFESNLTIAEDEHPCPEQWTPLNDKQYTDYFSTVTHGLGPISMTLDLYAPTNMPKHECCSAPLIPKLGCPGILGKPTSLLIDGTGPFCCPEGATPEQPCGSEDPSMLSTEVGALMAPAAAVLAKEATEPCCKSCELPKVKVFSTDAKHGFCGEGCMDPKSFGLFHKFESNLTIAEDEHPCPEQWTPLNDKQYTDYFSTVTHGLGPISMTLDLYAPTNMPKHECCSAPLIPKLGCPGILGKPTSLLIDGTGPFCCPEGATPEQPCGGEYSSSMPSREIIV